MSDDDDMIERVANAMNAARAAAGKSPVTLVEVRVGIAVMREPSLSMWDHAENQSVFSEGGPDGQNDPDVLLDMHCFPTARIWALVVGWRAMIDSALGDTTRCAFVPSDPDAVRAAISEEQPF